MQDMAVRLSRIFVKNSPCPVWGVTDILEIAPDFLLYLSVYGVDQVYPALILC